MDIKKLKEKICKKEEVVFDSWKPEKKKVVCVNNRLIHFGDSNYEDYTQHKDKDRRANFRARHNCDSKTDKTKAGYWACKELWLMFFCLFILSIGFSSAALERVSLQPSLKANLEISPSADIYPAVQIKDWLGMGADIADLVLTEHTASCSKDCTSTFIINTYQDSSLVDAIKFYEILDNGDRIDGSVNSYQLYIQSGETYNEVEDTEWTCKPTGEIAKNGTEINSCNYEVVGSHTETIPTWREYSLGEVLPAGSYTVKITGTKQANKIIDWIIDTQGKTIDSWALWGAGGYTVEVNGKLQNSGGTIGAGEYDGVIIRPKQNVQLYNVTLSAGVTDGGTIYVYNQSATLIGSVVSSGLKGTFASPLNLTAGVNYSIVVNNGAGMTHQCYVGGALPVVGTYIDWVNGSFNTAYAPATGYFCNVANVTVGLPQNSITLNNPVDNYLSTDRNVFFSGLSNLASGFFLKNISLIINNVNVQSYTTIEDGLVAYYKLNDNASTQVVVDSSSSGNTGTLFNAANTTNVSTLGKVNNAFKFDGVNDYVNLSSITSNSIFNNSNGFTLSAWIYQVGNSNSSLGRILDKSQDNLGANGFLFAVRDTGQVAFKIASATSTLNSNINLSLNNWHYVSINVLQNGNVTMYINGNYNNGYISSQNTSYITATRSLVIGSRTLVPDRTFNGTIDEVRIYNRSLSASEVSTLYQMGLANHESRVTYGNDTFNYTFATKGTYNWTMLACDSDGDCGYATNRTLTVAPAGQLALCNPSNNVTFLNVTFKDEVSLNNINASVNPVTVNYYLNNVSDVEQFVLINTTENRNYAFCYIPANETLKTTTGFDLTYYASSYPLRTSNLMGTFTNVTNNTILYLLNSADGLYQTVIVTDGNGIPLQGALVSATNSNVGLADSKLTDTNGQVSLWLNPNTQHTLTVSKASYPNYTAVLNPSTTTVYVTLGTPVSIPANVSITYTEGVRYTLNPPNQSLENNTAYNFQFVLTQGIFPINSFGFTLYNSSNGLISNTSALTSGGTVTANYNVGNDTSITMIAYYTSNGTTNKVSRTWRIYNTGDGDYSINFFSNRLKTYIASGMFGLTRGFGLNLICFFIILITTGVISYKYGLNNPILVSLIATLLTAVLELGLGLIYMGDKIPLTVWAVIVTLALVIREGMK